MTGLNWSKRFSSALSLQRLKMFRSDGLSTGFSTDVNNSPMLTKRQPSLDGSINQHQKPHLDINKWLEFLDLIQYKSIFSQFNGVEDLLYHSEAEIKDLGVRNSAHRARIVSNLLSLKMKYENGLRRHKPGANQRHSVAVDGRRNARIIDSTTDLLTTNGAVQSKSLGDLIMEDKVEVSNDSVALKKALEWELSLDTRDLCSHAWYHGNIPRTRAEEIVERDGEFLVRDCTSQPGNYVLSCRTKGQPLHFVINKVIIQPDTVYERVQYQFEDEAYDTVPDLITYYVGSGKPISVASGARIQYPRNRMYPLSFYASKYPSPYLQSRLISPVNTPLQNPAAFRYTPYNSSPHPNYKQIPTTSNIAAPEIRPRLPTKKQRSQSLTPAEVQQRSVQEKCNSADGVILQSPLMTRSAGSENVTANLKFSTHSLPRSPYTKISLPPNPTVGKNNKHIIRVTSDPSLSPCAERRKFAYTDDENEENIPISPPPKPSRVPSILRTDSKDSAEVADGRCSVNSNELAYPSHGSLQRVASYHTSGSDSGNGSGDSAQSSAAGDIMEPMHRLSGVVIKNPRYNLTNSESTATLKNMDFDYVGAEESIMQISIPDLGIKSKFDIENFTTLLLPSVENKPLDQSALQSVKMMLRESGPRIIANHLTRVDLQIILGDKDKSRFGSGIELCSLHHGHQLRLDIIERTVCMKLLVAVTILTCSAEDERAEMLNKWIEVANDTKTALGNLYGFCGIMLGLCTPQIQKLDTTWHILRQKHTDSAFNFEAKLRPTLKNMNECNNPQAPNTTIPHIIPIVLLQERTMEDFTESNSNESSTLIAACISSWESKSSDFGLSILFAHTEEARKFAERVPTFRRNSEIILGDTSRVDELMLDAFRTEFHLKFLWGSKGAYVSQSERHVKFEQILKVLADKYIETTPVGTSV